MNKQLFKFQYTNPDFNLMRCFLGNGYQSIEISNNLGQGAGICNYGQSPFPIMRVAGIYSYPNVIPTPEMRNKLPLDTLFRSLNTFGIFLLDPDNPSHPNIADLEFYLPSSFCQTLDTQQAIVTTQAKIGEIYTETEVFLSRNHPNFGVMKIQISKSTGPHLSFHHVTRKDPFTCLQKVKFLETSPNSALWELEFPDDNFEFQKRGLYHVVQITGLEIRDEKNNPLNYSIKRTFENTDQLDFDQMPIWRAEVVCENPKLSQERKYRWTVILYFGVFKQSDFESPLFKDLSLDTNQKQRAMDGLEKVMKIGYDTLLKEHIDAWQHDVWDNLIEVPGADDEIQKRIISSFYVIGCTYLDGLAYGNGPNGINGQAWSGRTFWDHDLWVNLGIILWAPAMARNFNLFRFNSMAGARENRKRDVEFFDRMGIIEEFGLNITDGLKYAWESTTSGLERTPNGSDVKPNIQEHISCDVIYSMWLQYLVTQDRNFLEQIAFPVAYESALYLGQRVNKEEDRKWHFHCVLCADEFANLKDDNAFTNLYVEKCMKIVIEWCKLLKKPYPPHWNDISINMKYYFDSKNKRILEHATYSNEIIKQADTDLITWPLEHDAVYGKDGETIRRNNMLFYFNRLPENHIMMSACIFSIIASELSMKEKAWDYFSDQFPHFHPNLSYIPSESPKNDCWPFITGIGGFLSNLIYGFGGIRLRSDGLLFDPHLDPKLPHLIFPRLKFQGKEIKYEIISEGKKFVLTNLSASGEFNVYCRNGRIFLPKGIKENELSLVQGRTEKKFTIKLLQNKPIEFQLQE